MSIDSSFSEYLLHRFTYSILIDVGLIRGTCSSGHFIHKIEKKKFQCNGSYSHVLQRTIISFNFEVITWLFFSDLYRMISWPLSAVIVLESTDSVEITNFIEKITRKSSCNWNNYLCIYWHTEHEVWRLRNSKIRMWSFIELLNSVKNAISVTDRVNTQ